MASSVSVTLQVNKSNDTTEEKPPVGQSQLCVCALATRRKKGKRRGEKEIPCTATPSQTVAAGLLAPRGDRKWSWTSCQDHSAPPVTSASHI